MPKQPIAELFGFPPESTTEEAERYRRNRLCPYNNKVPNCTKDSIIDPLGVCSIFHGDGLAVICPVRLRQDWIIAEQAAEFFFPFGTRWTTLVEVRLKDKYGKSAGNIDVVLVAYDEKGTVIDFGSLEVQTVYISGNLRRSFFQPLINDRGAYLQLSNKANILSRWRKKTAIAVDISFFDTMPAPVEIPKEEAEIAWLIYDIKVSNDTATPFLLRHHRTVYSSRPEYLGGHELLQGVSEEEVLCQIESEFENLVVD